MRIALLVLPLLIACGGSDPAAKPDSHAADAHGKEGHDHGKEGHDHGKEGHDHGKEGHDHGKEGGHAHGEGGHDHGKTDAAMVKKPAAGAKVMFLAPADGATVKSPVKVQMGVEGMTVKPAGELTDGTGHHHIIIDADAPKFGEAVPADETHIHFGKGQTEVDLELSPGKHKLTLQFADGAHRSFGEQLSTSITVTVE